MGLFGRKATEDSYQQSLIDQYAFAYQQMGMPITEAKKQAMEFVQAGIAEVASRGWQSQPENYGDILLSQEQSNKALSNSLNKRRKDGVTDDDIRWWWNMPPLDRVLIEKSDEQSRVAAFISFLKQGLDSDEAATAVFKVNPNYGELIDSDNPDRPIPIELKKRIVEWSEREQLNPSLLRLKMEQSTTFNALIRSEIAEGRL